MKVRSAACCFLLSSVVVGSALGQAARPPYTLEIHSRVVLTDVTVTDRHGNPVTGLNRHDFSIFDNGRPQQLSSFDEHREQMASLEQTTDESGQFSNTFLRHPPPQVNVLLFDDTTMDIADQMYLFEQMKKFVASLPVGEPVAVYTRSGDVTVQVANFTSDHAALLAGIRRAIPRLQQPGSWMASEEDTLRQMAFYLSQVPGRKNLLWFSGGSNLFLNPDEISEAALMDAAYRRRTYDMLEAERIAIYPIDARGLTMAPHPWQNMQMIADAAATGGKAYINTNGLALAADRILNTDGDYYTLTYSPTDLKNNHQWHHVEVKLDRRGYHLSYRQGYFDDASEGRRPERRTRTRLRANGNPQAVPNDRSDPILFSAQVLPVSSGMPPDPAAPPLKRGQQRYVVKYTVHAKDIFARDMVGNQGKDVVGAAALDFDSNGYPVSRTVEKVTMTVNEEKARRVPHPRVTFNQEVNLPKGQNYLYLAVWDMTTGRLGMLNASVDVDTKPESGKPRNPR